MGPVEALKIALEKEESAIKLYQKFLVEHTAAKDVFEYLLAEEEKHKTMINKKITELTRL
ncbi:MAG: hypothetical protein V1727_05010 [Candidatus Omnitrophota bacterium]